MKFALIVSDEIFIFIILTITYYFRTHTLTGVTGSHFTYLNCAGVGFDITTSKKKIKVFIVIVLTIVMSILKPDLIWSDGRCYRIEDKQSWKSMSNLDSYIEPDYEQGYADNDECLDKDLEIIYLDGNKYKHSFHVPR